MESRSKLKGYRVTVRMICPYVDSWLHKPSNDDVLEALANLILSSQMDDLFVVDIEEEEA